MDTNQFKEHQNSIFKQKDKVSPFCDKSDFEYSQVNLEKLANTIRSSSNFKKVYPVVNF